MAAIAPSSGRDRDRAAGARARRGGARVGSASWCFRP